MSKSSIRDTFFEECEDLLEALTEGLTDMETAPGDTDVVNAVFRAVHSIKGGAGAFGLDDLVTFAHGFETVLDMVRDNTLSVDPALMRLFHKSGDQLADLVETARAEVPCDMAARDAILKELEAYLPDEGEEDLSFDAAPFEFAPATLESTELPVLPDDPLSTPIPEIKLYRIGFTPTHELYINGHEPLLIIDHLAELGNLEVSLDLAAVPGFESLTSSTEYPGWKIRLTTAEDRALIEDAFEFVEGLCNLTIDTGDDQQTLPGPIDDLPQASSDLLTVEPVEEVAEPNEPASDPRARERDSKPAKSTLRVDLDRVDRLINTVGELIINQAMISQCIEELDLPPTSQILNEIEDYKLLARDIQEGVMAIRAQPVKPLFQRMARIVRETSEATGKAVRLITIGENTEVDKTVIERLSDPLTHMVRNAVDHGLEPPNKRVTTGKDLTGTIRLTATHRSGNVILEIADDGAGINRPAVRRKAIEKGLISPDAELTEGEIDNLLFAPGFSTAAEVSNLSGRGVGMDVVKTAVQKLGGRIAIASAENEGSSFSIILPLTLAVMDGFVVSIADQTMVVPISSILETVSATQKDIHVLGLNERLLLLRGKYIPIINVAESLMFDSTGQDESQIYLVVEADGHGLCALEIGEIHDQRQIVVKSLDPEYGAIPGVSAATILGDGKIALILDTDEIARRSSGPSAEAIAHLQNTDVSNV